MRARSWRPGDAAALSSRCTHRYIELNPVRAALVDAPERYPWSSAQAIAAAYPRLFVHAIPRDQDGHRLADGFLGRIAEHPLGAAIPGLDDAVEILADNGVVGRLDDGREPLREIQEMLPALVARAGRICPRGRRPI
jgi:hypothetical protein